jgi:hypothetical protein
VINVVKTAHEFLVCTTVGTPAEDDTVASPKLNTEQDVLSVFRMYWFLWTTRLFQ